MKVIRKWKRWLAVSCSHGHLANAAACKAAIEMKRRWIRPGDTTMHLGDAVDLAALRAGAMRDPNATDRSASIREDFDAGINFLRELRPTHFFAGNHEDRLYSMQNSPSAIVAHCATSAIAELMTAMKEMKTKVTQYDIEKGWVEFGGTLFGHGYMFSEMAVRDHVECLRHPVVFGHLHRIDRAAGRCIGAPVGWSIGCLADIGSMHYARRNRSVTRWAHGIAYGEYVDGAEGCTVNVLSPVEGEWRLPI
jgi:hypothetical protein